METDIGTKAMMADGPKRCFIDRCYFRTLKSICTVRWSSLNVNLFQGYYSLNHK